MQPVPFNAAGQIALIQTEGLERTRNERLRVEFANCVTNSQIATLRWASDRSVLLNLPDFVRTLLRLPSRPDKVESLEVNMFSLNRKDDQVPRAMGRRSFLIGAGAAAAALAYGYLQRGEPARAAEATSDLPKQVSIVEFSDSGQRKTVMSLPTVTKTEDEWRKQLSPDSFEVTRRAATESPYTNENPNKHAKGVFRCICCDTALFDSSTKFESGTGWPSFWAPIAKENILETTDNSFGMVRTAVSCRRCDAHLGHVFDDGPPPTGLRYCMNSVAMRFAKAS
jgi:peptide-methionine (R)-S-oxide reductase